MLKGLNKLRIALLIAFTLGLAVAQISNTYFHSEMAFIKGTGPEDPLEAWSEAAARNMSTNMVDYLGTNDDTAIQGRIDACNSSGGGSVYVKSGTYTATITVKQNVLLVLDVGVSGVTCTVDSGGYCIRYSGGYAWFEQPLNMTGHEIQFGAFHTGTVAPSNPNVGQWWYDTNTYNLKIYNGTDWATVQGAQGPAGESATLEGEQPYSYLVFKNATAIYMQNGTTGAIDYYNTNAGYVFNAVSGNLSMGGKVAIGLGVFSITHAIRVYSSQTWEGMGVCSSDDQTKGTVLQQSGNITGGIFDAPQSVRMLRIRQLSLVGDTGATIKEGMGINGSVCC